MTDFNERLSRLESERVMYDFAFQKFFKDEWSLAEREAIIAIAVSNMYGNDNTKQGATAAISLGINFCEKTSKRLVEMLADRGVIEFEKNEDDGRVTNIFITDEGRMMFEKFLDARDKVVVVAAAQRMNPSDHMAGHEHIDADIYFNARDPQWAKISADQIAKRKAKFVQDRKKKS